MEKGEFRMKLRCLPSLAVMILALSVCSQAQSLGDLARQLRAEHQQSGTPHTRVFTNDDIASSAPAPAPAASKSAAQAAAQIEAGKDGLQGPPAAAQPAKSAKPAMSETDKRIDEINHRYLDRIAEIQKKINMAQAEVARLQQEQAANTFEYRRTLGVFPNPGAYVEQQQSFNEQIKTQTDLITSLSSQLDDAKEAARHAGVPNASD
jgi:uncharacterized protein YukE